MALYPPSITKDLADKYEKMIKSPVYTTMYDPTKDATSSIPHKRWFQAVLQNIILGELEPSTAPEIEIVCECTRIAGRDVVLVAARNKKGELHTFADDAQKFPSPQLLNKMRLFK